MTRYVIIGDGGAGTTAAFYIRRADPHAIIEIYSDDPNAAYYRAALTNYLIGELREAQLFATPPDFYQAHHIQRLLGKVSALDEKNSRLTLDNGTGVAYDQLLIASGAKPNPPSFPGADLPGVMTMRTLQDARTVMDLVSAKRIRQAIVVGGGPLGIEWAQGLLHHHVHVTYLLRGDMFFERALDRTASDLVISRLRSAGVDVRLNEEIAQAIAGKDGRLRAVRLKNSAQEVECQLIGAAIGISPNLQFLTGSAVEVAVDPKRGTAQGIKVNQSMRTNIANVYAAGDVIHHTLGLWEPARLQGRVAGRNMAGGSDVYHPPVHYNATRLYDLDFGGVGELVEKNGDQTLIDFPKGSGRVAYRKLIIRENKLVGAIMLGHRKEQVRKYGAHYQKLIETGMDLSSVAKDLLAPSFDLAAWMDSHAIGDQIESARRIGGQQDTPSGAHMRMTRSELNAGRMLNKSVISQPNEQAALLFKASKLVLKNVTLIGRKADNDLVLNDPDVSSQHAQIRSDGEGFLLEDLKSTNGTFLNGTRISAPTRLAGGALIKVGGSQIQFVIGSAPQNLRMTSAGLPEAPETLPALSSDEVWGVIRHNGHDIALQVLSPIIGRDAKADIVIDDAAISYRHAQIRRQANASYLYDLGSRNGTSVNGSRISVQHLLADGDVIKLGETSLTFHSASAPRVVKEIVQPAPTQPQPVSAPSNNTLPLELKVTIRGGELSGRSFPLQQSPITVGRDPQSKIIIKDETVSWHHAILMQEDKKWFVKDLGSSNHTFLNDEPLNPNQLYPIHAADTIRFGDAVLEVTQNDD